MLSRIMKELQKSGPLHLDDLATRLKIERTALDGMIDHLVRSGKLREEGGEEGCQEANNPSACSVRTPVALSASAPHKHNRQQQAQAPFSDPIATPAPSAFRPLPGEQEPTRGPCGGTCETCLFTVRLPRILTVVPTPASPPDYRDSLDGQ